MSASIRVRQFFSAEGMKKFKEIFERHQRAAAAFPGFVVLRWTLSPAAPECVEFELAFETDALLKEWRSSPEHAQIAAAYRPLWTRPPELLPALGAPAAPEAAPAVMKERPVRAPGLQTRALGASASQEGLFPPNIDA